MSQELGGRWPALWGLVVPPHPDILGLTIEPLPRPLFLRAPSVPPVVWPPHFLPLPCDCPALFTGLGLAFSFSRPRGPIWCLTDEETDAQRGADGCPRSHSELEATGTPSRSLSHGPSGTLGKSSWWVDTRGGGGSSPPPSLGGVVWSPGLGCV